MSTPPVSTPVLTSTCVPVMTVTAGTGESAWPSIHVRLNGEAALPSPPDVSMMDPGRYSDTGFRSRIRASSGKRSSWFQSEESGSGPRLISMSGSRLSQDQAQKEKE